MITCASRSVLAMLTLLLVVLVGCASHKPAEVPKPVMNPGEGAIDGKLVDEDGEPFDMKLATDSDAGEKPGSLEVKLMNADRAVVAVQKTAAGTSRFAFSHVKPGAYEVSVYRTIIGKRTIAGSDPITVDAQQVTPVTLKIHVKDEPKE